ncbi:MAG: glucan biosynthesis protein D [Ketobacter sp.]
MLPIFFVSSCAHTAGSITQSEKAFDYAWLKGQARSLSVEAYQGHEGEIPESLRNLSWDQYQELRYVREQAIWTDSASLFRAELFHLGLYFKTPVKIHRLHNGKATEIPYSTEQFDYGKSGVKGSKLPEDVGFAGFRYHFHTDWERDILSFLGASYFRAVGTEMQYGLSARGLAIDTALPSGEEFPVFTQFWLQEPEAKGGTATVYALLDTPSATGAYQFTITPGDNLVMKVDAAIYPRKKIERLGVAPLTSMYMIGENDRRAGWDWRPEIHDSDGLLINTGAGEWIWRPLTNPEQLQFNAYQDNQPKGFGLMQRDRNFEHYLDDGVFYEKRPSLWIEPLNHWGEGSVQLVEIPTLDETFDNIVAFWNPSKPVAAGEELLFSYNMVWGSQPPSQSGLAKVADTYTGIGGVVGQKRKYYSKRFVVDFAGGNLPMIGEGAGLKAKVTASSGKVELTSVRPQHHLGGFRAMFDLVPGASQDPVTIRLYLESGGAPLTETWVYQWIPPAKADRKLHNAGHLK